MKCLDEHDVDQNLEILIFGMVGCLSAVWIESRINHLFFIILFIYFHVIHVYFVEFLFCS